MTKDKGSDSIGSPHPYPSGLDKVAPPTGPEFKDTGPNKNADKYKCGY